MWVMGNRMHKREERIAVQEDMIQVLSSEVEELRGKICRCNKSPCIGQGSGQEESPYKLSQEEGSSRSLYFPALVTPAEGNLVQI